LRPAVWWRQPLPAWAQAAAALLIFAAGMTFGSTRTVAGVQSAATPAPVIATVARAPQPAAVPTVSRDDLVRIEQRLRAVETARVQAVAARPANTVDEAALFRRVEALIAASEARSGTSIYALRDAVVRLDAQQRGDMRQVADRLGLIHDTTQREFQRQSDAVSYLISRASLTTTGGR
jgi:hypothetical protein